MEQEKNKKGNFLTVLKDLVTGWPLSVKILAGILLVVVIIGGGIYNNYCYHHEFISLYESQISSDEIDKMTSVLTDSGYRQGKDFDVLKADKFSYMVAQRQLAGIIREELEREGYPENNALIDNPSSMMTEDERDRLVRLQQEQSLAKQIRSLEGIKSAVVNIVPEHKDIFEAEDRPAKSSVTLTVKNGFRLNNSQTESIMNIVSGAVEGLKPENVKVIGSDGVIYSDRVHSGGNPEEDIPMDVKEAHRQDIEDALTRNAREILDGILGPGKAKIQVHADMNFDGISREMVVHGNPQYQGDGFEHAVNNYSDNGETITIGGRLVGYVTPEGVFKTASDQIVAPSGGAHVRSLEIIKEKYENGENSGGDGKEGSDYENIEQRFNYELDQTKTVVVESPGKVERITVGLGFNSVPEKYIDDLVSVVAATVGLDESRGDVISVVNMPFNIPPPEVRPPDVYTQPHTSFINPNLVRFAGFSLVMFAMFVAVVYVTKKKRGDFQKTQLNLATVPPSSFHTITGLLEDKAGNTVAPSGNGNSSQNLTTWAKQRPDEVAKKIMNSWLKD